MLAATVPRTVLVVLAFVLGVLACPDYDYMEKNLRKPTYDSNSSDSSLDRRWYTVETGSEGPAGLSRTVWPSSTMPYCWQNSAAQTALEGLVRNAWELWIAAGVPATINMGEYNNCPVGADGNVPPDSDSKYLLITYNTDGLLSTTVGYGLYNTGSGPVMNLDPDPAVATGNAAANVAHEIGHAWGFYHEQQRPNFWASTNYVNGVKYGRGTTNQINFYCTSLRDYAQIAAGTTVPRMQEACRNYDMAQVFRFTAREYLPFYQAHSEDLGDGVFDWDSLMLYGSEIGGAVIGGVVQNVYVRASDNAIIPFNTVPSPRDVQRFKALYPQSAPSPNPCLINQACSAQRATFLRIKAACNKLVN